MAKYDDDMMEAASKNLPKEVPQKFRIPKHLRDDESDRISNLPSDTALESNKKRQDEEMKSALKRFGRAMLPGQLGVMAAEEATKPRAYKSKVTSFKDEGDTASGLPREARGKPQIKEENPKFVKIFKKGGKVSSASARADGIAQRGKTKGRFV